MTHRMITIKSATATYLRCVDSGETAVGGDFFSAYHKLNGQCQCKHRAHYSAEREVARVQDAHTMRVRPQKQTRRTTVSQLNDKVNQGRWWR